jgi:hypothetical protein
MPAPAGGPGEDFAKMGDILVSVLPSLEPSAAALLRVWSEIVGAEAAENSEPLRVRGDVLLVAVSSPAWGQRLAMREPEIMQALARHADVPPVGRLSFRPTEWAGGSTSSTASEGGAERDAPAPPSTTEVADLREEVVSQEVDPALGRKIAAAFEAWARGQDTR